MHNECDNELSKKINEAKKSFMSGKDGEKELANMVGGKSQSYMQTSMGEIYRSASRRWYCS